MSTSETHSTLQQMHTGSFGISPALQLYLKGPVMRAAAFVNRRAQHRSMLPNETLEICVMCRVTSVGLVRPTAAQSKVASEANGSFQETRNVRFAALCRLLSLGGHSWGRALRFASSHDIMCFGSASMIVLSASTCI